MKLSVLMPVYNEAAWVERIVTRVLDQRIPGVEARELVIVDDGSTDGTTAVLRALEERAPGEVRVFVHPENRGKGAALRTAIRRMTGEVCIIQDGDLEYDPADYEVLLRPILEGRADCVYGSRFIGTQPKRVLFFWHYVGNRVLTLLSNMLTNINLTDMETCYKAFRAEVLKAIPLKSDRFGFEPEITIKVARRGLRIYEAGISYNGRSYAEGKKIGWKDGLRAIGVLLWYAVFDRPGRPPSEREDRDGPSAM